MDDVLSLPLDREWTNSTVPIQTINDLHFPNVKYTALWFDDERGNLYSFGGAGPHEDDAGAGFDETIWHLDPDGEGGGFWWTAVTENSPERASEAGYAACGNTGYVLGGIVNQFTDESYDFKDDKPYEGFYSFRQVYDKWAWVKKDSSDFNTPYGTYRSGRAACGSVGDSDPLLFAFGGRAAKARGQSHMYMPFDKLYFYDTKADTWHLQTTRGDIPPSRSYFCAVGTESPSGTYEM